MVFDYCLYVMYNSYTLEVYVCVLIGNFEQKDGRRPAAERLFTSNA